MPNRILREGIVDSAAVNSLSEEAEIFYRRLMSIVDDYGRYEAYTAVLRGKLFAMCIERWPEDRVLRCLNECAETEISSDLVLVSVYVVDNKKYLQINKFGQRMRTESKYPGPGDQWSPVRPGSVYFIQAKSSGRIKIGYTEWNPTARLGALQTGSADELVLLGAIPGTMKTEREIHRRFASALISGEWFNPTEELVQFITTEAVAGNRAQTADTPPTLASTGERLRASRARPHSESESEAYSESESANGAAAGRRALASEWPQTAAAVRRYFPATDDAFVLRLVQHTIQDSLSVGIDTGLLSDTVIAKAVESAYYPKQTSAGGFLGKVPQCIRTWAKQEA